MLAHRANISVQLTRCDPAHFRGDPAALRQVLLNLLDNAIKHNHPGGRVRVELRAAPNDLAIQVENAGFPIPADLVPRLFQRFARGSAATAGFGLGLSLAKTIVEAHKGTIAYESEGGNVVRFKIRLPYTP